MALCLVQHPKNTFIMHIIIQDSYSDKIIVIIDLVVSYFFINQHTQKEKTTP